MRCEHGVGFAVRKTLDLVAQMDQLIYFVYTTQPSWLLTTPKTTFILD